MKPVKIRPIVQNKNKKVYGIYIPESIALMNNDVYFTIKQDGTKIILESGCSLKYTKEEIKNYDFADCRV